MVACRLKLMHGVIVFSLLISMYSYTSNYDASQTSLVKNLATNVMHDRMQGIQACNISDTHEGQSNIVVITAQDDNCLQAFDHFAVLNDKKPPVLHRGIAYFSDAIECQNSFPTLQDAIQDEYDLEKMHHREVLDQLKMRQWSATLKKNRK